MPVKIDTDLITIISLIIGFGSLLVAVYQWINSKRTKKMYENHCKSKCKNIVTLTHTLTHEVVTACEAINIEMENSTHQNNNFQKVAIKLNGINVLTQRLKEFCSDINEEHESQFGYKVYPNIEEILPSCDCLNPIDQIQN